MSYPKPNREIRCLRWCESARPKGPLAFLLFLDFLHIMSRGDLREDVFLDDIDRHNFLKTLAEACQKTDCQFHAYCLMRNHFHLVLETSDTKVWTDRIIAEE